MHQQPVKTSHFLRVHQFRLDTLSSGPTLHPVTRLAYERMYWTPLADYLAELLATDCTLDLGLDPADVAASIATAERAAGREPRPIDGNTPLGDVVAHARALALPLRVVRTARWLSAATYAQRNPEVIARLADAIPQTDAHSGVACIDEYDVDRAIYPTLARPVPTSLTPGLIEINTRGFPGDPSSEHDINEERTP